jgi:filamentous hemagglutinin family protein
MQLRFPQRLVSSLVMGGALIASLGDCAFAQIVPDPTLGTENSRVTGISPTVDQINGGATRGTNLFHSFQEFNVGEGRSAYFTNPAGIENILTRVTGTNPSNILGTLGITGGNANLFLINPNGIIFGSNARLDVGGSFVASTASSIKFADGTEFSAVNPSAPPLLTISVPIGLQFNGTEGDIVVQGNDQTPTPEPTPEPAPDNPFTEVGDAGQLPGTAQPVNSPTDGTTFNAISGNLDNGNDVDLYQLFLTEGQPFTASTVDGTEVDTQLFLFDGSGLGLSSNDDSANTLQSTVPLNEPFTPAASGTYYLGISSYDNDPLSSQGYIFDASGEPTGPGAGLPLSEWDGNNGSDSGAYTITLNPQPDSPTLNPQPNPPIPLREGLQVQPGKTLALVGGNVTIQGGNLQALSGRVELGGVAGSGTVGLNIDGNNIDLSFPDGVARADVSLTNAFVKVTAGGGGSIALNARNLDILGNSELAAGIGEGLGAVGSQAGDITLNATEAITIGQWSSIKNEVGFNATGNGGDINIKGGSLLLNSTYLSTTTSGQGDAGSVSVQANRNISFERIDISSNTSGQGNAGSVLVQASDNVSFANNSTIRSTTSGQGNGGSVSVQVNGDVSLADFSFISSKTFGQGDAGSISVQVNGDVSFVDSSISSQTSGEGDAGSISVQVNGNVSLADFSELTSSSLGEGDAGSISVQVNGNVSFTDISGISSITEGEGDAGSITVLAKGDVSLAANSFIRNDVYAEGKGSAIHIQTQSLSLRDSSKLFVRTFGSGNAGNIQVDAVDSVTLSGVGNYGSTGLFTNTEEGASGQGGDITVRTGALHILDGAVLSATTRSNSGGGNITADVNTLEIRGGGQMLTTAFSTGNAGSIAVSSINSITLSGSDPTYSDRLAKVGRDLVDPASPASGLFSNTVADSTGSGGTIRLQARSLSLANGAEVNVSSQGLGNAGELRVEANSISLVNGGKLEASTASGLGGNIELQVQDLILMRLHSLISANAENNGNGGNVTINAPFIVAVKSENSDIIANAFQGRGGNINITTQGIYGLEYRPQLTPNSDINASSRFGVNGTVQINTPGIDPSRGLANLPTEVVDASNQIAQTCAAGGGEVGKNEFIITGRRGMPSNPYEMLSNERPLEDIHPPSGFSSSRNSKPDTARIVTPQSATSKQKPPIVEAQGWVINDKGQVVLTAIASTTTPHNSLPPSATCSSS